MFHALLLALYSAPLFPGIQQNLIKALRAQHSFGFWQMTPLTPEKEIWCACGIMGGHEYLNGLYLVLTLHPVVSRFVRRARYVRITFCPHPTLTKRPQITFCPHPNLTNCQQIIFFPYPNLTNCLQITFCPHPTLTNCPQITFCVSISSHA